MLCCCRVVVTFLSLKASLTFMYAENLLVNISSQIRVIIEVNNAIFIQHSNFKSSFVTILYFLRM